MFHTFQKLILWIKKSLANQACTSEQKLLKKIIKKLQKSTGGNSLNFQYSYLSADFVAYNYILISFLEQNNLLFFSGNNTRLEVYPTLLFCELLKHPFLDRKSVLEILNKQLNCRGQISINTLQKLLDNELLIKRTAVLANNQEVVRISLNL